VEAFHTAGNLFVSMKEYAAALNVYDEGLRFDAGHAGIYVSRGDVYFRLKQFEEAIADYTSAIECRKPNDPANKHLPYARRGLALCHLERYREASADFQRSFDESPAPTLNHLALSFRGQQITVTPFHTAIHEPLVALYDRYVVDQKYSESACAFRADGLAELKLYGQARERLEKDVAAMLREEAFQPWTAWGNPYRLGMLILRQSDYTGYRRYCQRIVSSNLSGLQGEASHIVSYTLCVGPGGLDEYTTAIELSTRACLSGPTSSRFRMGLGLAHLRAGNLEQARRHLHDAMESKWDVQNAYFNGRYLLAIVYHRLGQPTQADLWLKKAHEGFNQAIPGPGWGWRPHTGLLVLRSEASELIGAPSIANAD
jgi:tetratricopeptide (TPR) repeat protein